MPVDTGRSDGEHSRHYRGRSQPLGQMLEWSCPSCGQAAINATINPPEKGCPTCGAGAPGYKVAEAGTRPAPASDPAPASPRPTASTQANQPAPRARQGDPALDRHETVYRILAYTGPPEWLEETLRLSLVGQMDLGPGRIIAAIVDDVSTRQQDLLGMARRQPGVWLGNDQPREITQEAQEYRIQTVYRPPTVVGTSPVTRPKETAPMADEARPAPATGPVPTTDQALIAETLRRILDDRGCYTLAMALNQFSATVEDETMEPEKFWRAEFCLGVASGLLSLIPADWQPDATEEEIVELPPPAPGAPPVPKEDLNG